MEQVYTLRTGDDRDWDKLNAELELAVTKWYDSFGGKHYMK